MQLTRVEKTSVWGEMPIWSSNTGRISFKRACVWAATRVKADLCGFQQGVLNYQYGNLQLSSFQYIVTSRSRCCHLNSTGTCGNLTQKQVPTHRFAFARRATEGLYSQWLTCRRSSQNMLSPPADYMIVVEQKKTTKKTTTTTTTTRTL